MNIVHFIVNTYTCTLYHDFVSYFEVWGSPTTEKTVMSAGLSECTEIFVYLKKQLLLSLLYFLIKK